MVYEDCSEKDALSNYILFESLELPLSQSDYANKISLYINVAPRRQIIKDHYYLSKHQCTLSRHKQLNNPILIYTI